MHIDLHQSDQRGNIVTLLKPAKITFRGKSFVIPAGFESDGVSTPRFLWSLISPALDPRTLRAGVAHDYIYRTQPAEWTRHEADLMFLCFCVEDNLEVSTAVIAYAGLGLFGGKAWRQNALDKERNDGNH